MRDVAASFGGAEIKTEGDSFYLVFPSASGALRCGLGIAAAAASATEHHPERPIRVGVGVHAGESAQNAEGYVGSAVNIAARVCAQAAAGEVLASDTVRSLTRSGGGFTFMPRGRRHLKGIAEPVSLYAVELGHPLPRPTAGRTPRRGPSNPIAIAFSGRISSGRRRAGIVGVAAVGLVGLAVIIAASGVWSRGRSAAAQSASIAASSAVDRPTIGIATIGIATIGPSSSIASGDESPTGPLPGRITFISSQVIGSGEPRRQAYIVAAAAGGPRERLTPLTDNVAWLCWQPNGRYGVYEAIDADGTARAMVIDIAAPGKATPWPGWKWDSGRLLIGAAHYDFGGFALSGDGPACAPNGDLIAQGDKVVLAAPSPRYTASDWGLYRLSRNGSSMTRVTRSPPVGGGGGFTGVGPTEGLVSSDGEPSVSPDGRYLAFTRSRTNRNDDGADIWVAGLNGSGGETQITDAVKYPTNPSWSSDGNVIVFSGSADERQPSQIWSISVQGTGLRQLTSDANENVHPSLSPNGKWIVWNRIRNGSRELWVMGADGANPHLLLSPDAGEQLEAPTWIISEP